MGKGLHKVFKYVVNELKNVLPNLGKSGSKVSHFIPESRTLLEVTRLPSDVKKGLVESNFERDHIVIQQSKIANR